MDWLDFLVFTLQILVGIRKMSHNWVYKKSDIMVVYVFGAAGLLENIEGYK